MSVGLPLDLVTVIEAVWLTLVLPSETPKATLYEPTWLVSGVQLSAPVAVVNAAPEGSGEAD